MKVFPWRRSETFCMVSFSGFSSPFTPLMEVFISILFYCQKRCVFFHSMHSSCATTFNSYVFLCILLSSLSMPTLILSVSVSCIMFYSKYPIYVTSSLSKQLFLLFPLIFKVFKYYFCCSHWLFKGFDLQSSSLHTHFCRCLHDPFQSKGYQNSQLLKHSRKHRNIKHYPAV